MKIGLIFAFGLISYTSVMCFSKDRQTESAPSFDLALNGQRVQGSRFVIDLGMVPIDRDIDLKLSVGALVSGPLTIDAFHSSDNVSVEWELVDDEHGLSSRKAIGPHTQASLLIKLRPSNDKLIPLIVFYSEGKPLGAIGLSYTAVTETLEVSTSSRLNSVPDTAAHYQLCTGKRPEGYGLECNSVSISASSVGLHHEWSCGKSITCRHLEGCAAGVNIENGLSDRRGFCEVVTVYQVEQAIVPVDVSLKATFVLQANSPHLMSLEQFQLANTSPETPGRH